MARLRLKTPNPTGPKIAMVGSGPASLMASFVLAQRNYRVTVFEALHRLGGVLIYGVPPFRLPREILDSEIARLESMGVKFETDVIVGNSVTLDELFNEEGFEAVFLGTGAGLPYMLNIPGENLIGVYTANEFLTRINLMHANEAHAETPVNIGKHTVVIGGGNSAMDAARWSKRLGADTTILFRRGRAELRARAEEIEHAEQEGIKFEFLGAPVALFGDKDGWLNEMECLRMELGAPDSSGRPSPVPIPGSNYRIPGRYSNCCRRSGTEPDSAAHHPATHQQQGQDRGRCRSANQHAKSVCRGRCRSRRIDRDPGNERWTCRCRCHRSRT